MFVCVANCCIQYNCAIIVSYVVFCFVSVFVFCMLNLAYSGLVLFGKFLYLSLGNFSILVHMLKLCNNVFSFYLFVLVFLKLIWSVFYLFILLCSAFLSLCWQCF